MLSFTLGHYVNNLYPFEKYRIDSKFRPNLPNLWIVHFTVYRIDMLKNEWMYRHLDLLSLGQMVCDHVLVRVQPRFPLAVGVRRRRYTLRRRLVLYITFCGGKKQNVLVCEWVKVVFDNLANFLSISPNQTYFLTYVCLVPAGLFCYSCFNLCSLFNRQTNLAKCKQ